MKIYTAGKMAAPLLGVAALAILAGCNTGPTMTEGTPAPEPGREVYRMSRVVDEMNQGLQRDRMVSADMNQRVALLEGEIRQLRGTVDELRHENTRLRDQSPGGAPPPPPPMMNGTMPPPPMMPPPGVPASGDMGRPAAMPAPAALPPGPGPAPAADPNTPMRIVVGPGGMAPPAPPAPPATPAAPPPAFQPKAPGPVAAVAPGSGVQPPAPPPAQPLTPEKSYDEAFVLLKSGQYDKALPAFESFVRQNTQHDLADNGQYWIGEMHYVQRRFTEALVAFNKVLVDWPASDKVPASLLKIGFSFYELEDLPNAKSSLERLIKEYPESSAVTPARQRLKLINQKMGNS